MTSTAPALEVVSLRTNPVRLFSSEKKHAYGANGTSAGMFVTLLRAPLAALGVWWLVVGDAALAITAFCLFAGIDVIDGVVARSRHEETAARRIADVVIDRVAIQSAVIAVSIMCAFPVWLPMLMLARDVMQGAFSAWFTVRYRSVVVGPRMHMSYGLAMLAWGALAIVTSQVLFWPTLITIVISASVLFDYVVRCQKLGLELKKSRP